MGDAGVIYATVNGGASWNAQSSGVSHDLKGVWFTDAENGWATGLYGSIIHTESGGN